MIFRYMRSAGCQCGHVITGETSDDVAREMGEHIASAHPTMKVPDQAEMRRLVGKARMYGETAQATILLHKKDEE